MKLLIIHDIFSEYGGGSQLCAVRWFKNLNLEGVLTYFLKNKISEKINFHQEKIIEIPSLDLSFMFKNLKIGTFLTQEAISKIKEVDLIIFNEPSLVSFLLASSKDFLNKKMIFVFHTNYDYFLKNLLANEKNFSSYLIKFWSFPVVFLRNFLIKNSDAVIFVSHYFQNLYKNKIKTKSYYLPIPISDYFFSGFSIKEKEPNSLVYFGRLSKEKRVSFILKIFQLIRKKYKLFIIGEGIERENLEELASKLKIRNQVEFLGWIKNEKLPGILKEFDFFISASDFETFGATYLEALLSGLPPIVYDYPITREVIPENCGIFVKNHKPESWAKILLKHKDKNFFVNLQKNILKKYKDFFKFHEKNSTKKLIEICQRVLKRNQREKSLQKISLFSQVY